MSIPVSCGKMYQIAWKAMLLFAFNKALTNSSEKKPKAD